MPTLPPTTQPPTTPPTGTFITIKLSMVIYCLPLYLTAEFEIIPSPLNVTVEQQVAIFHCQHGSSNGIIWRVNGTAPNSSNVTTKGVLLSGGGYASSLSIRTLLDFNDTTIKCVAIFLQGSPPFQFTTPVALLIQG